MIRIEFATRQTLHYIAHHLRETDRRELEATSWTDDVAAELPSKVMLHARLAFVAIGENPICAWGLVPVWPGVGSAFAFGTEDWGRGLKAMTGHIRRFILPWLLDNGFHRVECRALAHRDDVRRWLALFGAAEESVLRSSGKRGEDFILYRWLK